MKKDVPGKRATRQAETTFMRLYEEKVDPFSNLFPLPIKSPLLNLCWSQLYTRPCSDCFALTELTQLAGRAKVFMRRKVDLAKRGTMVSKKVHRVDGLPF